MSVLPEMVYQFSAILNKIPVRYLVDNGRKTNIIRKNYVHRIDKHSLERTALKPGGCRS